MKHQILVINPGSTSTKIAWYEDETQLFSTSVVHDEEKLAQFENLVDQFDFRKDVVIQAVEQEGFKLEDLSAVIGRGGLIPRLKSGGYLVTEEMCQALRSGKVPAHAANLGALIAYSIAKPLCLPAYIYDAVTSGELSDVARVTGIPDIVRQSFCHALNSRAMARKYAQDQGKRYEDMRLIVTHMGGGISVTAHVDGKIIDSMSDDDGQFSPERSGGVPLYDVVGLCYSGKYTEKQMLKMVRGQGGMYAHLGTSNCMEIERRIDAGDEKARVVYEAQAYQIAKGIGVMAPVLKGDIDAIIFTGGVANSKRLTGMVADYVSFLAPIVVLPGENEMEALAFGALRMLKEEEHIHTFKGLEV